MTTPGTTPAGTPVAPQGYPHALDIFRRMDGLDALLMMQRGEVPSTPITRWMNFSLETVERGHVVFAMVPHDELYNLIGSVHGGIITTLMDNALGCAVQSVLPASRILNPIEEPLDGDCQSKQNLRRGKTTQEADNSVGRSFCLING